jgi:exonuclease VII small subunit
MPDHVDQPDDPFEDAMESLDAIVASSSERLPLEEMVASYERG